MARRNVEIEAGQRAAIFELRGRTPPVPYAKIAEQLGIPESTVYREHKRQAPNGRSAGEAAPVATRRASNGEVDPEVEAAERRVELLRFTLQEHELQRRLALLDGKVAGQESAIGPVISLLSEQMRRVEENLDRRIALAQPTKPAEDPMTAMVRGMGMLAELQQKAAVLAPPAPIPAVTNAADVEDRILLEKMRLESETTTRAAAAEAERNAFIFGTLKENAPMLIAGFQKWMENQSKRPVEAPLPRLQVLEGGRTEVVDAPIAEVAMTCASCRSRFMVRPEPGELPLCTVCGGALQPDGEGVGKIVPPTPKPAWPEDATFG